jgi:hypothetical protein
VVTPGPRLGVRDESGADWVEREIPRDLHKVAVAIDEQALESTPEDVPHTIMSSIERLAVDAVQLSECPGDGRLGRLEEQMVVIPHQAVSVTAQAPTIHDRLKSLEEHRPIDVIEKDRLPGVAPCENVKELTSDLES